MSVLREHFDIGYDGSEQYIYWRDRERRERADENRRGDIARTVIHAMGDANWPAGVDCREVDGGFEVSRNGGDELFFATKTRAGKVVIDRTFVPHTPSTFAPYNRAFKILRRHLAAAYRSLPAVVA